MYLSCCFQLFTIFVVDQKNSVSTHKNMFFFWVPAKHFHDMFIFKHVTLLFAPTSQLLNCSGNNKCVFDSFCTHTNIKQGHILLDHFIVFLFLCIMDWTQHHYHKLSHARTQASIHYVYFSITAMSQHMPKSSQLWILPTQSIPLFSKLLFIHLSTTYGPFSYAVPWRFISWL